MIAVTPAPARMPKNGLEPRVMKIVRNASCSRSGCTASDMVFMPIKRIPKPMIIAATSLLLAFLLAKEMITSPTLLTEVEGSTVKSFAAGDVGVVVSVDNRMRPSW